MSPSGLPSRPEFASPSETSPYESSPYESGPDFVGPHLGSLLEQNAEINLLLQQQAEANLTTLHRPIERLASLLGRPAFIVTVLSLFLLWTLLNSGLSLLTHQPWDSPPFFWLQGLIGVLSLIVTATVLISQARQARVAEQRSQLQLQIVLLTEQRSAKIIGLLEELRRDLPNVHNRHDAEAEIMTQASDPQRILKALEETLSAGPLDPAASPDPAE
ncbi:DUF1003 domain-containing protein [Deinococcus sp.]|uniref:DUF1003 domain-containing protein n=1 Tax=Deinococcus sp. TaxID=47478 RepID=UPI0025EF1B82|nr:DUF1003 domain-containing protein [Deinococcus sp.]